MSKADAIILSAKEFEAIRAEYPVFVHIGDADAQQLAKELHELIASKRRPTEEHIYDGMRRGGAKLAGITIVVDEHRAADNFYFRTK